jgi:hypothetical protein
MTNVNVADWHKPYQDAMTETDERKLPRAIAEAESVIFMRWQVLTGTSNENSERIAIHNALNDLRALKPKKHKTLSE